MLYTCHILLAAGLTRPVSSVPAVANVPPNFIKGLVPFYSRAGGAWEGMTDQEEAAVLASVVPSLTEKRATGEIDPRAGVLNLNLNEHPRLYLNSSDRCLRVMRGIVSGARSMGYRVYGFRPYRNNDVKQGRWAGARSTFDGYSIDAYPQPCKVVDQPGPSGEAEYAWYAADIQRGIAACAGGGRPLMVLGTSRYFQTRVVDTTGRVTYDGDTVPTRVVRLARAMAEPFGDFCVYDETATKQGVEQYAASFAALGA